MKFNIDEYTELAPENLKSFIRAMLVASTANFDVTQNLHFLDIAWEAQKQLWAKQELLAMDGYSNDNCFI